MITDRYPTRLIEEMQRRDRDRIRRSVRVMKPIALLLIALSIGAIVWGLTAHAIDLMATGVAAAIVNVFIFRYQRVLEREWL